MVLRTFVKITTQDSDINKLQTNLGTSLDPLLTKIQLDSNIIQGIQLTNGIVNIIPHKLNRVPIKLSVMPYAQADVWFAKKSDGQSIYLYCSANVVIDIEVA